MQPLASIAAAAAAAAECRCARAGFARALALACSLAFALVSSALAEDAPRGWGPEQAIGRADTTAPGDQPTAWASATEDGRDEWLVVEYGEAVVPTAVRVFASYNPGALAAISAFDEAGAEVELWRGIEPSPAGAARAVALVPLDARVRTKRLKLHLASRRARGWNEIDAVYLHGPDGSFQWAIAAEASSTFAAGGAPTSTIRAPAHAPVPLAELEAAARTPAEGLYALWLELRAGGAGADALAALAREVEDAQRRAPPAPPPPSETTFAGRWETTFGVLRLTLEEDQASGIYPLGTLEGRLEGDRLAFTYDEGETQGEGWFQLAPDGQRFEGRWRAAGETRFREWTGERAAPAPDRRWLVILEAPWQEGLGEPEYSFGAMLRAVFSHAERLEVRQRFFTDATSFEVYCREIALLEGEVFLVVASHATVEGLQCQAGIIPPERVARALARAPNLKLVHFSACDIMAGPLPQRIFAARPKGDALEAVSGYAISVDWMASALTELTYLDLLLNRELAPAKASEQLVRLLDFADDRVARGSAIPAAHFRLVQRPVVAAPAPAAPAAPAAPPELPPAPEPRAPAPF